MPGQPEEPDEVLAMSKMRRKLVIGLALLAGALGLATVLQAKVTARRVAAAPHHEAAGPREEQPIAPAAPLKLTFDADPPGSVPKELEVVTGKWAVVADDSAPSQPNALAQLGRGGGGAPFNLCVVQGASFSDVAVELKFHAVAGNEDQGGGPVWRYQDKGDYYVARYNPLEDNYRVYKVVEGRRIELQSAVIKATPGWHKLTVEMIGDHIACSYDGKPALDVKDDTFAQAGRVGLWSKADAQTHFDDFTAATAGKHDEGSQGKATRGIPR